MKQSFSNNKYVVSGGLRRKILPAVFILLSLLLMVLQLEGSVASLKALLSYIFIPQIRAAHETVEYSKEVSRTITELLDTHRENQFLKEQLLQVELEKAQAREIFEENERLNAALGLQAPQHWKGIWAKVAYREPSQWNSIVIDKGLADGVQERSAAIVHQKEKPVLAGVVLEAEEHTAKVLLLRDEDFAAVVYGGENREEGLLTGDGGKLLKMQYLALLSSIKKGDEVYTSAASSIFPAGILVGKVVEMEKADGQKSSLTAQVEPATGTYGIQELFILTRNGEENHADIL